MALPKIRQICYTDDGCTLYECLSCHAKIEMRNDIFRHIKNEVTGDWDKELVFLYCPYCGIKFDGYIEEKERKKYYDEKRFRTNRISYQFSLLTRIIGDTNEDWMEETFGDAKWVLKVKKQNMESLKDFSIKEEYKIVLKK